MKKLFLLMIIAFFFTCAFATITNAQKKVLSAQQVTKLFNNKSMTATEAGTNRSVEIHASSNGGLGIAGEDNIGPQGDSRRWSVTKEGKFCYSKDLTIKTRVMKRKCGFIVPVGSGAYEMYHMGGASTQKQSRNPKNVGGKGSKHIWTFSNFK